MTELAPRVFIGMSTNEPLTMRWLYTSTAIITPARRLAISDAKLRFELAFLEFHMHFGNMQYRDQLAILREEMLKDLCYNGKSYPPKVFTWLLSMYTGKEPFQDGKNTEKEGDIQYCEGISMEGKCTFVNKAGNPAMIVRWKKTGTGGWLDQAAAIWFRSSQK